MSLFPVANEWRADTLAGNALVCEDAVILACEYLRVAGGCADQHDASLVRVRLDPAHQLTEEPTESPFGVEPVRPADYHQIARRLPRAKHLYYLFFFAVVVVFGVQSLCSLFL